MRLKLRKPLKRISTVLDIMMPYVDGVTVCRTMRNRGITTPILMLTARHEVNSRVDGLDAGADDYLVKPFALEELLARVRALLRRSSEVSEGDKITFADLSIDLKARRVTRGDSVIELTQTEFNLLVLLAENAEIVIERDVIYDRIWESISPRVRIAWTCTSDTCVARLKKKANQDLYRRSEASATSCVRNEPSLALRADIRNWNHRGDGACCRHRRLGDWTIDRGRG